MGTAITRRAFSGTLAAAGLGRGGATRPPAAPASETIRGVLDWFGYPARDDARLALLEPLARETLRGLEVVRRFEIPIELEPAVVFRPEPS